MKDAPYRGAFLFMADDFIRAYNLVTSPYLKPLKPNLKLEVLSIQLNEKAISFCQSACATGPKGEWGFRIT